MDFIVEELQEIAEITKAYQVFMESLYKARNVEVVFDDWQVLIPLRSKSGDALGYVGFTNDGEIGFVVNKNA